MSGDNLVEWPGSRRGRDLDAAGESRAALPEWISVDACSSGARDEVREAIGRLLTELFGADDGRPPDPAVWRGGLNLQDAGEVVGRIRRAVLEAPSVVPAARTAEIHRRLDAALAELARDEADRVAGRQRRLLEEVSHDIRSPLNSILFLADALRAERTGALNPVQQRQVGVLYTAAVTLVKLANDLIDFARLSGREQIHVASTTFSVESVVADVRSLLGPLIDHRGVRLRCEVSAPGPRMGDPQLLSRILLNLISNAVEAAEEAGTVELQLGESGDGLEVRVSDDRLGTDVEKLRRMLEIREDEVPGETRGWTRGLGLAISARLVQAAGGTITVEGLPGEGTVFRVELPFPCL